MKETIVERTYQQALSRHISGATPVSEASDRFVKRCIAQGETPEAYNALLKAPVSRQAHEEIRQSLVGNGKKAWKFCSRKDATVQDLHMLAESFDDNHWAQLAAWALSPEILNYGFQQAQTGDRRWDQLVINPEADGKRVAGMLDSCLYLISEYAATGNNFKEVLTATKHPKQIALALTQSGRVLNEPTVMAICEKLRLDDTKTFTETPDMVEVVDALIDNGWNKAVCSGMGDVAKAVKASNVNENTTKRLNLWVKNKGWRPISYNTSDIELAQQISQADGPPLNRLLEAVGVRLEKMEEDGGETPIEALRAAWEHPTNQTDSKTIDLKSDINQLFGWLNPAAHKTALETLIKEQKDPGSCAALIDAIGRDGGYTTPDWAYLAATVDVRQLAEVWAGWVKERRDGQEGKVNQDKYRAARGERSIGGLFAATNNAAALACLGIQNLDKIHPGDTIAALDKLLGENDDAWVIFETFADQCTGTVGEVAEMCQLAAISGHSKPKPTKS